MLISSFSCDHLTFHWTKRTKSICMHVGCCLFCFHIFFCFTFLPGYHAVVWKRKITNESLRPLLSCSASVRSVCSLFIYCFFCLAAFPRFPESNGVNVTAILPLMLPSCCSVVIVCVGVALFLSLLTSIVQLFFLCFTSCQIKRINAPSLLNTGLNTFDYWLKKDLGIQINSKHKKDILAFPVACRANSRWKIHNLQLVV